MFFCIRSCPARVAFKRVVRCIAGAGSTAGNFLGGHGHLLNCIGHLDRLLFLLCQGGAAGPADICQLLRTAGKLVAERGDVADGVLQLFHKEIECLPDASCFVFTFGVESSAQDRQSPAAISCNASITASSLFADGGAYTPSRGYRA